MKSYILVCFTFILLVVALTIATPPANVSGGQKKANPTNQAKNSQAVKTAENNSTGAKSPVAQQAPSQHKIRTAGGGKNKKAVNQNKRKSGKGQKNTARRKSQQATYGDYISDTAGDSPPNYGSNTQYEQYDYGQQNYGGGSHEGEGGSHEGDRRRGTNKGARQSKGRKGNKGARSGKLQQQGQRSQAGNDRGGGGDSSEEGK